MGPVELEYQAEGYTVGSIFAALIAIVAGAIYADGRQASALVIACGFALLTVVASRRRAALLRRAEAYEAPQPHLARRPNGGCAKLRAYPLGQHAEPHGCGQRPGVEPEQRVAGVRRKRQDELLRRELPLRVDPRPGGEGAG